MIKKYRPITPGTRQRTGIDYSKLSKVRPEKSLTYGRKRFVGRSTKGSITVRHKGGGHKRLFREIDFKQNKLNIPATVSTIEYDPNRSAFIMLLVYKDGEKRYGIAPDKMTVGQKIIASEQAPFDLGNRMPLGRIPVGFSVHNVETFPGKGGQIIRSAGNYGQVMAHEGGKTHLLMPSSEVRVFNDNCWASIGMVSNQDKNLVNIGKAGRSRWMGKRPTVRGAAMNPVDHPHGGGEGRAPVGLRYPKTPWGKQARGVRTRKKKQQSRAFIVRRRVKNK
jgi:large subunit ribosomal protein L2